MIFKGIYNIRLVSTESIIAGVYEEVNDNSSLYLDNPMEVMFYPKHTGNTMISLSPWMPFAERNNKHKLYSDTIITMSVCEQSMVNYYNGVVTKYMNAMEPEIPGEDTRNVEVKDSIDNLQDLEDSLDIMEAMAEKSKGKLH